MGIAAAIVIFVGHMSVTIVLWPVHVFKTYNTIARSVLVTLLNSVIGCMWSQSYLSWKFNRVCPADVPSNEQKFVL